MRRTSMVRPLGLDPDDPIVRTAVFGLEVQEWLSSPVGSYVMNRVRQKLTHLEASLKTVDPSKAMDIAGIQAEIRHWEAFAGWLGDAVQAGLTASEIIDGEQNAEDA
jgi:hypothetical protein